jgi:hypothetical protein
MKRFVSTIILFALTAWPCWGFASDMYVVVNAPVDASLDEKSLLALIKGQRRNWDDGNAATVVLPSRESDDFELVAQRIFGVSGRMMQRLWFRVVFSGYANAPEYLDEPSGVVAAVADKPGALGILLSEQKPEVPSSLRVVALK